MTQRGDATTARQVDHWRSHWLYCLCWCLHQSCYLQCHLHCLPDLLAKLAAIERNGEFVTVGAMDWPHDRHC